MKWIEEEEAFARRVSECSLLHAKTIYDVQEAWNDLLAELDAFRLTVSS